MIIIRIPTPLRKFTGDKAAVEVEATNVQGAIDALLALHENLGSQIGFFSFFFPSCTYSNDHDVGWCMYLQGAFARFGIRREVSRADGDHGCAISS